jgi:hypothetical protein
VTLPSAGKIPGSGVGVHPEGDGGGLPSIDRTPKM